MNAGVLDFKNLPKQRSVAEQVASLSDNERACFDELKAFWKSKPRPVAYSDYDILRFARCSPGATKFNAKTAKKVMVNYAKWSHQVRLSNLNIHVVRHELERHCLIIPGFHDKDGNLVLYMRPSFFSPKKNSLDELMRALVYLLERVTEDEEVCTKGICFMANMKGWGWSNFGVRYCKNFMDTMQGRFPLRVRKFLICNPPSWFGAIWKIMRPMLSADFAAKVDMPKGKDVGKYFANPTDFPKEMGGAVDLKSQLSDFVQTRYRVEGLDPSLPYGPDMATGAPLSETVAASIEGGENDDDIDVSEAEEEFDESIVEAAQSMSLEETILEEETTSVEKGETATSTQNEEIAADQVEISATESTEKSM